MKIVILGSGARERVICEKLSYNNTVYVSNTQDLTELTNLCIKEQIDLVIPSTEDFLCSGIVDKLNNTLPSVKVFGPNKYQSQLKGLNNFPNHLWFR